MSALQPLILFVNPRSGSTLAAEYLQLPDHRKELSLSTGSVTLFVFDLISREKTSGFTDKERGFQCIRSYLRPSEVLRIFIAGGDGSLVGMLQDLISEGLPLEQVAISTLPFGTGNDLAAMLGWGRGPKLPLLREDNLIAQAELWTRAIIGTLDFWEIGMTVGQGGFFLKVERQEGGFRKKVESDDNKVPQTHFQRLMSNYFSLGVDARIGFGFDKARTRSKVLNKVVYAWEGFKKLCCLPVSDIQDFIESFEESEDGNYKTVFHREHAALGQTFVTVIAQNIRNYAASDHHLWDSARKQVTSELIPQAQSASDGLLEFIVFPAGFGMALEQVIEGNSMRLHQGRGPFRFRLVPRAKQPVYVNVDGEYYAAVGLQEVTIALSPYSRQLRVMRAEETS